MCLGNQPYNYIFFIRGVTMKLANFFFVLVSTVFVTVSSAYADTALQLKGSPEFVSEAPLEKIVGVSEGTLALAGDFADLTSLKATVSIPVSSMKTGNKIRDEHLQGSDWLNAAANPNITFTTKSIEVVKQKGDAQKGKATVNAIGNITINGVSKEMTAPVKIKWSKKSVKVKTKFEIALADFKVAGAQGVVGNKVGKSIAIKAKFKVKK